ncbi:hypothetical protein [Zavarzinella formosa]|uniref:hypothetical protein n=1 Tax=Zavarzinella formosa TaxID=360055 RepID=UPI0002ED231C|nr:hypothetical protein [Zavarzinella formosa]
MFAGLIFASLALGGGTEAKAAEPVYEFKLDKPEDSATVVKEAKRTVFVVTSPNGIGQGTIILKAGQWPENVTLRFQRARGKGISKFEHFSLTTDRVSAQGELKLSDKLDFDFLDAKGKSGADRRSAGVLNVVVESRDDALDVTLPTCLLIGSPRLELSWIDVLRR